MKNLLLDIINKYEGLILIINGVKINSTRELPKGSVLSLILFSIYLNNILDQLNKQYTYKNICSDIIILSNDIIKSQKAKKIRIRNKS